MEGITRLVSESLARHGFDRPLDYRRLQWSRWFRCESVRSLLFVPSKPGVFALAEEIMEFGTRPGGTPENSPAFQRRDASKNRDLRPGGTPETDQSQAGSYQGMALAVPQQPSEKNAALAAEGARRMLAVAQFFEDDDMAFVLDRMLSSQNPMRARLLSGRYFVRFVAIDDEAQRRSICSALNQWISSSTTAISGEPASAIGAHFATSLELTESNVARPLMPASATSDSKQTAPFPSGF